MIEFINLALTWFLVGLIWIVQVVHYPSFRFLGEDKFRDFHDFHTKSITKIVAPTMLFEVIFGGYLAWSGNFSIEYFLPFLAVVGIWLSTIFYQLPLHAKLSRTYLEKDIEKLISTNWIRTILWTLKGVWLLILF